MAKSPPTLTMITETNGRKIPLERPWGDERPWGRKTLASPVQKGAPQSFEHAFLRCICETPNEKRRFRYRGHSGVWKSKGIRRKSKGHRQDSKGNHKEIIRNQKEIRKGNQKESKGKKKESEGHQSCTIYQSKDTLFLAQTWPLEAF